jgi:hypothetical protein
VLCYYHLEATHKRHPTHKEETLVHYHKLRSNNWKLPEPDPEPEEEQAVCEPQVDVVINSYHEKGDAKSFALKVSIRLPVQS